MSEPWKEPTAGPRLENNEVHVWFAHLSSARPNLEKLRAVLVNEEITRAEKFHFVEHRERWQMTRGVLRMLLASYVGTPPREISFRYNQHGKPGLKQPAVNDFHFNTSHSRDCAVFAFTRAGEVGVDIEGVQKEMPRRDDIVRRYFAPGEQRQFFELPEPERARAFFKLWTRKEAFVKARGTGLFSGLDQFAVSLDAPRVTGMNASDSQWWMKELPSIAGHEGAVVVHAASCNAQFWKWSWRN